MMNLQKSKITLVTKVHEIEVNNRVPNVLYTGDEGIYLVPIYQYMDVSEETFNFLNQIAHVSCHAYGDKTYTVNGIEFKVVNYGKEI